MCRAGAALVVRAVAERNEPVNPENPLYRQHEAEPSERHVRNTGRLLNPSFIMLLLAAVLTLPAGIAFWQDRTLNNEERFISVGNDVLRKESVQRELARGLTADLGIVPSTSGSPLGQIVGNNPELGSLLDRLGGALSGRGELATVAPSGAAAQPSLMESIALRLLAASPGTPLADIALGQTLDEVHLAIRADNPTPEDKSIVLDLGDTVKELLPTGGAIVGDLLPPDAGRVEVLNSSDLSFDFTMARWFDGRATLLILLPLAVFAAGFFVAPNWARFCLQGGLALAISAGLWIIYAKFIHKPMAVDNAIHSEQTRSAANDAYDVIINGFVQQELIVIGAGLVIAGASYAFSKRAPLMGQAP